MKTRLLVVILCLVGPLASAASKGGSHDLSVSGGIASPALSTAVFQNPAGLVYPDGLKLGFIGQSPSDGSVEVGGGLLYGKKSYGLAAGIQTPVSGGTSTSLYYGLGVLVSPLQTSFGVSGNSSLSAGGSSFNLGALINPEGRWRFGFTVRNLESISELGAGLAYYFGSSMAFVVDAATDSRFGAFVLKPGFHFWGSRAGLTMSYGLGNGTSAQLDAGLSVGGHLRITKSVSWQVYYKQLSRIFTAVTVDL